MADAFSSRRRDRFPLGERLSRAPSSFSISHGAIHERFLAWLRSGSRDSCRGEGGEAGRLPLQSCLRVAAGVRRTSLRQRPLSHRVHHARVGQDHDQRGERGRRRLGAPSPLAAGRCAAEGCGTGARPAASVRSPTDRQPVRFASRGQRRPGRVPTRTFAGASRSAASSAARPKNSADRHSPPLSTIRPTVPKRRG